jgi:two-component system phosphate regulon sensor histidine kinase PhoR
MFWRLFLTYLLLVAAAAVLVGALVLQRVDDPWDLARDVATASGAVVALAVPTAYLLARRFTRPLDELTGGAARIAEGDFALKVHGSGPPEVRALAQSFNVMTDRLAATFDQLARDREQLRTVLSGMVEGVVAFDNEQRVLFANDRAAQLLEFTPDQAVGRKLWEVTRQRAVQEVANKALRGGGPVREELDWKGPADRSLAVYVSRLPGPGSPGAVMVLHDISELRRLERLRQDFVANVSHELKTPLANIKSSVEVLLDGAAEDPSLRGVFLDQIDEQATRLDALIKDLLSLARIEGGSAGLEFEPVPVEDAVHACLDRHRTRAEAKGLNLNGVALGGCPPDLAVWADEEGLAQVLDNLVDNAIKYTPDAGRVTVRWQATPQQVTLEVEDTGIGIPEPDQPRVFERFYRVDKARSREMGGTGLGLSIVKHLVQAMGGTVGVESEVGRGTTFRVSLPRTSPGAG